MKAPTSITAKLLIQLEGQEPVEVGEVTVPIAFTVETRLDEPELDQRTFADGGFIPKHRNIGDHGSQRDG